MRKSIMLWVMSMAAAAGISAAVTAQVQSARESRVLSGPDIGFRVESMKSESKRDMETGRRVPVAVAVGRLVVRVNGEWVEAQETVGPARLTQ